MAAETTPLMRQYHSVKEQVPGALLFFRMGDFYELFMDDAVIAARELEITLTSRNKDAEQPIPMAGVPYHAADGYLTPLQREARSIRKWRTKRSFSRGSQGRSAGSVYLP